MSGHGVWKQKIYDALYNISKCWKSNSPENHVKSIVIPEVCFVPQYIGLLWKWKPPKIALQSNLAKVPEPVSQKVHLIVLTMPEKISGHKRTPYANFRRNKNCVGGNPRHEMGSRITRTERGEGRICPLPTQFLWKLESPFILWKIVWLKISIVYNFGEPRSIS